MYYQGRRERDTKREPNYQKEKSEHLPNTP